MAGIHFEAPAFPPRVEGLREEVRDFLARTLSDYPLRKRVESWSGFDPDFSGALGARGWIGMGWPKAFGGSGLSLAERYTIIEELLAAGAPVSAHWIADRQSGPLLLSYGTEEQKLELLPRIASGTCYFCIGMSEAGAGSDLGAVRTRAVRTATGFRINGAKLWTTNAHRCHYMILFCRTSENAKTEAMSQLLIDLSLPGITISPIRDMTGKADFCEVVFQDVEVPISSLIGEEGQGWMQVMSELALERSGPERFLSTYPLLAGFAERLRRSGSGRSAIPLGRLISRLVVLRHLSRSVTTMLSDGQEAGVQAALVKDLGAVFEQDSVEACRDIFHAEPLLKADDELESALGQATLAAPSFSLRGGTREVLRGIVARNLGVK